MVSKLFKAKTETIVPVLRQAAALAYHRRWWGIFSAALQRTVVTNLLDHPSMGNMPSEGPETPLRDLLKIAMELPKVSRRLLRDDSEEMEAWNANEDGGNWRLMVLARKASALVVDNLS